MMGRVDDIAGSEKDPMIIYIGFATGGLWKSTDGGNHWKSQFDNMPNESIGAIAIAPSDPNIVYVGTGEANNRQSSSIGDGVWGTTDGGEHWTHLGLDDTQSIARIVVDPGESQHRLCRGHGPPVRTESRIAASTSPPMAARTGRKSKFIDNNTGFTDLAIDPVNPENSLCRVLSAPAHLVGLQRRRARQRPLEDPPTAARPGPGSKDRAGRSRRTDSTAASRSPIFRAKPSTIYAQVEAGASGGTGGGTAAEGGPARGGRGGVAGESAAAESAAPADVAPLGGAAAAGNAVAPAGGQAAEAVARRPGGSSRSQRQRRVPLRRWRQDLDAS